jgi:hypothetical protein
VTDPVAIVLANFGFWVARCPKPDCHWADYYGVAMTPAGRRVGGLTLDRYVCLDGCGNSYAAQWPATSLRAGVEQLLALRPDPAKRNWEPGETLEQLLWENAAHGIPAPDLILDPGRDGVTFAIIDDAVTVGGRAIYGAGILAELTPGATR